MTGRNPMHTGLDPMNWTSTILRPSLRDADQAVHKDYRFLPRMLATAGYRVSGLQRRRWTNHMHCALPNRRATCSGNG